MAQRPDPQGPHESAPQPDPLRSSGMADLPNSQGLSSPATVAGAASAAGGTHEPPVPEGLRDRDPAPGHPAHAGHAAGSGPARRGLLLGIGGAVVVVLAILGVLWARGTFTPEPLPGPTVTVTTTVTAGPLAPNGVTPAARAPGTVFGEALPDSVLDLVLTSQVRDLPAMRAGALDAWEVVYAASEARQVTVDAAQWRTPALAERAAKKYVSGLGKDGAEVLERFEVTLADGTVAGRGWDVQVGEASQLVWTNGTAWFAVSGAPGLARDVFTGFSL